MSVKTNAIKIFGVIALLIAGSIFGMIFLMRSCLKPYDSYGVIGWPGVTEDNTTMVIVKAYNQTTSYSSGRGITHKTYSTTYYLEKIDLATGKVTEKKKLIAHRKVKVYPVQCFGSYKNILWVMVNELKGYDMNTLELSITLADIEEKNPALKGKMPKESQYIDPHVHLGYIYLTALDGDKYKLDLNTLKAEIISPDKISADEMAVKIKEEQKKLSAAMDSLNATTQQIYNDIDKGKITQKQFDTRMDAYYDQRTILYAQMDSLRNVEQNANEIFNANEKRLRDLEDFDGFFSTGLSNWAIRNDTMYGKAYVLEEKAVDNPYYNAETQNSIYSESIKMRLYALSLEKEKSGAFSYKVTGSTTLDNNGYLQGGFLRDMMTAMVYQLQNPRGFIVMSKNIIGKEGKLIITRIDGTGKKLWEVNTQMSTDVSYARIFGKYLILTGNINSDDKPFQGIDGLRIIDITTGTMTAVKY